jgi:dTDP-4-dehydrorhamnose reductase
MNILITGCNGQLGNEMQLLEAKNPQHTYFNTDVAELDITDQNAIETFVEENLIDGIVNCAAYTAVDKAEDNQELCTKLNANAPEYLAAAIEKRGGWMVQISTDYVFDGTNHTPYVESDPVCPNSVYGRTKLAGEEAAQKACQKTMIIRTAWLYSTFGNNFVKTMIRLGKEKPELGVIFDQIGTPTYAHDLAEAIFTAINLGIKPGIYHFSNEGVISWYDFTKAIHRIAGITTCHVRPLHTSEYPTPANRPHYSVLDKTKIKQTYGIEVPYWEESLEVCIGKLLNDK